MNANLPRPRATLAAAALVVLAAAAPAPAALSVEQLRVEYQVDPLAVDSPAPRLSWVLRESDPAVHDQRQQAYEVRVATDPAKLDAPDLWDSRRVASDQQNQVAYAGRPLAAAQRCWWQVRVWDGQDVPTPWSRPAVWGQGLLAAADWSPSQWIDASPVQAAQGPGPYWPAVMLRQGFALRPGVVRATAYATAAGLYAMSINGRPVGRDLLTPGWTEYGKRLWYQAYDVTPLLRPGGDNAVGVTLADGWYGLQHDGRGRLALRAMIRVEYADGTVQRVGTDPTWRASADGPVRSADLYNGERYDARRDLPGWDTPAFDDHAWGRAEAYHYDAAGAWRDVTAVVRAASTQPASTQPATTDPATTGPATTGPTPAGPTPAGPTPARLSIRVENEALGGDPALNRPKRLRVTYTTGPSTRPHVRTVDEHKRLTLWGPNLTIVSAQYGTGGGPPDVAAAALDGYPGSPVRRTAELRPVAVMSPAAGVTVYDLGQNMVGFARLTVTAPAGTVVRLRFAERLNPDGTVYTANLRGAEQTDTYTCRGGPAPETCEPRFTFHGFRYVELTGLPHEPAPDAAPDAASSAVVGVVIGSDAPLVSRLVCSDPLLNQLQHNIVWGQRGNYVEVPTDCPQRDERRGWSGDAQAFIRTGTGNQDLAAFFTAWLCTYDDTQAPDGAFPDVAPHNTGGTSPGWGDAGVICPWALYQRYGDTRVLAHGYPHMVRWIDYLQAHSHDLIRPDQGYGDWLNVNSPTPRDLIATAYFARSTELVARTAAVLGHADDARRYAALRDRIAAAFRAAYVSPDGHVRAESQTAYLLALGFDLLTPPQRPVAGARLRQLVHDRDDHLSVGFLGVNLLLPVLTDAGDTPLAYALIEQDTYPSWGYPIRQGATTIWERWDGWTGDKGFQTPVMNSFNHYAYGSCGQWMFDTLAGLGSDTPGFAHLVIAPRPGGHVTFADAAYDSIRGPVAVHWGTDAGRIRLTCDLPPNVTATVRVPTADPATVTDAAGHHGRAEPGRATFEVGSGRWAFEGAAPR